MSFSRESVTTMDSVWIELWKRRNWAGVRTRGGNGKCVSPSCEPNNSWTEYGPDNGLIRYYSRTLAPQVNRNQI